MPRQSRIQISKQDIVRHFDGLTDKVFKGADIAKILAEQRAYWRLAQSMTAAQFTNYLTKNANLRRLEFPFPYRKEQRYTWGDMPLLEVLLTIKKDSYFTHYTAVRMHGLTEQLPKTIFLNHEQRPHIVNPSLDQQRITAAFSRKPRESQNIIDYGDYRICLINGMFTDQLGVVTENVSYDSPERVTVRVTNIERTLIDITVRPIYTGGVAEVLKAFTLAQGRASINRLAAMLQKLRYVYPYHQAIGFYLERAGYTPAAIDLLRQFPREHDFYLTHQIGETDYVPQWRLHIPKGF